MNAYYNITLFNFTVIVIKLLHGNIINMVKLSDGRLCLK